MSVRCVRLKESVTRQQLHEIGICSETTFERLLSRFVFEVESVTHKDDGRHMVYLTHDELRSKDNHGQIICRPWLWVYSDMVEDVL